MRLTQSLRLGLLALLAVAAPLSAQQQDARAEQGQLRPLVRRRIGLVVHSAAIASASGCTSRASCCQLVTNRAAPPCSDMAPQS